MLSCTAIKEESYSEPVKAQGEGNIHWRITEKQTTCVVPAGGALGKLSEATRLMKQSWLWSQTFWTQKLSLPLTSSGSAQHSLALISNPMIEQCSLMRRVRVKDVTRLVLLNALWEQPHVTSSQAWVAEMTPLRRCHFLWHGNCCSIVWILMAADGAVHWLSMNLVTQQETHTHTHTHTHTQSKTPEFELWENNWVWTLRLYITATCYSLSNKIFYTVLSKWQGLSANGCLTFIIGIRTFFSGL
jgi:hypothetical protein